MKIALSLLALTTWVSLSNAQCDVYLEAEDVCAADWGGIPFSISGTCDDPDVTFRVVVSYYGWSQCDDVFYDCNWSVSIEEPTIDALNWTDIPYPNVSATSGADVIVSLRKVFADGSTSVLSEAYPAIYFDYFVWPSATCDGSMAVHEYEVYWGDPAPQLDGSSSQLAHFELEHDDDDDHKRVVTAALEAGTYTSFYSQSNCAMMEPDIFLTPYASSDDNDCALAIPLESGEPYDESYVCGQVEELQIDAMGYDVYRIPRWFTVNSSSFDHLAFGVEELTWTSNSYLRLEVYSLADGANCDALELLAVEEFYDRICMNLEDYISILPNTNYYFRAWVIPTTDLRVATILSDTESSICGCSDPASCAFSPEALFDACPQSGCTNPDACNYQFWADCDNGTCILPEDLQLSVYHDENYNGAPNSYDDPLGGLGTVVVEQDGEVLFTVVPNGEGEAVIPDLADGTYVAYFNDPSGLWQNNGTVEFTFPTCSVVEVGANPTPDTYDHYSHFIGHTAETIGCTTLMNLGFWLLNIGAENLDGSVSITLDETLNFTALGEVWDVSGPGTATWNFTNQLPGEQLTYGIQIEGPGVDAIGEIYDLTIAVTLLDGDGAVFYEESHNTAVTVTCAYDPNDKTLMDPATYLDAGYVAPETEALTYRIRFQNTGNAPAQDVEIVDVLDPAFFDISSVVPLWASHEFYTLMDNDNQVHFVFDNIFLPDSAFDLQGSQGEVYFRVNLWPEVEPGNEFTNGASIYFDDNPPILTNTTSNARFDCAWMEVSLDSPLCLASPVLNPEVNLVESFTWFLDGNQVGEMDMPYTFPSPTLGENSIEIHLTNPVCDNYPVTLNFWTYTLPEDLDSDGLVNISDVLIIIGEYGCLEDCAHDLDANGVVGIGEILQVLGAVGMSCD